MVSTRFRGKNTLLHLCFLIFSYKYTYIRAIKYKKSACYQYSIHPAVPLQLLNCLQDSSWTSSSHACMCPRCEVDFKRSIFRNAAKSFVYMGYLHGQQMGKLNDSNPEYNSTTNSQSQFCTFISSCHEIFKTEWFQEL